ncbi:MAG: SPOR domain-containing protein [Candidatus Omnitrophica bacterium]|nr:SPOR domain-containing protein [Candidatus Omnitrophota bacterium]
MAENQDSQQSELFTQGSNTGGHYKGHLWHKLFFLRIRVYEKIILLIMGLSLASIISFSIGVERGKRIVFTETNNAGPYTYTIQVAAFKNRALALSHAQFLTKEVMAPMVFTKGSYVILCVGKFSNQESAQPLLTQLQKTYAGCRIRRL